MGCAPRELKRRLPLVIAVVAMIGMELDVLCNPFSPLQILNWLQPTDRDAGETRSPSVAVASDGGSGDASFEKSTLRAGPSGRPKRGPRLDRPLEIHDLIALRSKTRSAAAPLNGTSNSFVRPLDAILPGCGPESHLHHPHPVSLLREYCRMLC
jgi:hypothetical protein